MQAQLVRRKAARRRGVVKLVHLQAPEIIPRPLPRWSIVAPWIPALLEAALFSGRVPPLLAQAHRHAPLRIRRQSVLLPRFDFPTPYQRQPRIKLLRIFPTYHHHQVGVRLLERRGILGVFHLASTSALVDAYAAFS